MFALFELLLTCTVCIW